MADQADAQILSRLAPGLGIAGAGWGCSAASQGKGIPAAVPTAWNTLYLCSRQQGEGKKVISLSPGLVHPAKGRIWPGGNVIPRWKGREGVAGELPAAPPVPWDSSQIPTNNWRAVWTLCWGLFQVKLFYLKPPSPLLRCLKLSLLK